jgi:hypothetical protein
MSEGEKMRIEDMSSAIESELNAYAEDSAVTVKKAVKDTANEIKKDISANAPVGATGKYARSWRAKKTNETDTSISYTVHATKDGYRLAHLLEFGHAKRGGGKVRAIPHIRPAEEKGEEDLEKRIRGDLK